MMRPIHVGDELSCHIRLDSLRRAFGADVLTIRSRITNQHGEVVQEDYTVMAGRSEPQDDESSPSAAVPVLAVSEPSQSDDGDVVVGTV